MSDTQRVIDAFTEMAPRYEETVDRELRTFWGVGYHDFVEMILGHVDLGQARVVLDVATGRGEIPLAMIRAGWCGRVVGLDLTPQMIHSAQARLSETACRAGVALTCGSGMRLPFAAESFDTAICALATHHMQLSELLAEMHRVLRPGGQLLVADVALAALWHTALGRLSLHALTWWYTRQEGETRGAAEKDSLENMRTPEQWQQEIADAGFVALRLTTLPPRRKWYPPGILVVAQANHAPGSQSKWEAQP